MCSSRGAGSACHPAGSPPPPRPDSAGRRPRRRPGRTIVFNRDLLRFGLASDQTMRTGLDYLAALTDYLACPTWRRCFRDPAAANAAIGKTDFVGGTPFQPGDTAPRWWASSPMQAASVRCLLQDAECPQDRSGGGGGADRTEGVHIHHRCPPSFACATRIELSCCKPAVSYHKRLTMGRST